MPNPFPDDIDQANKAVPSLQPTADETSAYDPTRRDASLIASSSSDPLIGSTIGRYQILQKLGEGGMGSVYLALQSEPVKRQVALKLIKRGIDSRIIITRFESERQALAVMDHPNIARIYDGGIDSPVSTQGKEPKSEGVRLPGSPYFVMELVQGMPITDYCDTHRLSPRERLELFVPICQAVQHAHQKGVIHRDLKPNNVLVTEVDGKPVPKVIDFGVAKATEQPLTDESIGDSGMIVGTPAYMSPEQADPDSMDIDTRTDIYALGVMLYELLTGSTPIDTKQFKRGALLEVLRMVREVDPPRPSTKLSTAEALPSIAANRGLDPRQLQALLRNDIDWIVMKALEKDRSRRYETANGFATDVQRYLAGEAVLAHPPSRWYRMKKFVRRNRVQVLAATLVVLALIMGIIGTTYGLFHAEKQRQLADQSADSERQAKIKAQEAAAAEKAAREQAQKRLTQIEKGNDIITSIFTDLDISEMKKRKDPLEAILAKRLVKAAEQLEGEAVGEPLIVARLQNRLGLSLMNLGYPREAIVLFEKARDTTSKHLGPDHRDTIDRMATLGFGYVEAGKLDLALPLLEETLQLRKTMLGFDHSDTIQSLNNLAFGYQRAGRKSEVVPLFKEALKLRKATLEPLHPNINISLNNLAESYRAIDRVDLALPLWEESLKNMKALLGPDHINTLTVMNNLAAGYQAVGKLNQAVSLLEEAFILFKGTAGIDHPTTVACMNNLSYAYKAVGKKDVALNLLEDSVKALKAKLGSDHPTTLTCMSNLGYEYQLAGKLNLALPLLQEAATAVEKQNYQQGNADQILVNLSTCLEQVKQYEQAEGWRRKRLTFLKERSGTNTPVYFGGLIGLSYNLFHQKKWAEAETPLREGLTRIEKLQPDAFGTYNLHSMLGAALLGQKKYADAEPLLLKGYQGLKRKEKTIPPQGAMLIPDALDRLIQLYTETSKPDEAKKWQAEKDKLPK